VSISVRRFHDRADLAALSAAISTSWILARPSVNVTVGDVEWWTVLGGPAMDWAERIRLWERDGEVVAWAWLKPPAHLDQHVRADLDGPDVATIVRGMTDWLDELATLPASAGPGIGAGLVDTSGPLRIYASDADRRVTGALEALGFTAAEGTVYSQFWTALDVVPPAPRLPPGYRIRSLEGPGELDARVELHRAAFAPSRLTRETYRLALDMGAYALERDLVVEAPDGSLAAFTLVWWDPVGRVGEFEPVGTHPDHRGRGLGRAVNLAGLHLLRSLEALDAVVFSDAANPASEALYASAGFRRLTSHRPWARPRP
jgi:GNAT superfamily N-acetyltransferase